MLFPTKNITFRCIGDSLANFLPKDDKSNGEAAFGCWSTTGFIGVQDCWRLGTTGDLSVVDLAHLNLPWRAEELESDSVSDTTTSSLGAAPAGDNSDDNVPAKRNDKYFCSGLDVHKLYTCINWYNLILSWQIDCLIIY